MNDPHADALKALLDAACDTEGELDAAKRRALIAGKPPAGALGSFAIKVSENASAVKDEHVEALRKAGHSEDQIFETVVASALGAGMERLRVVADLLGVRR